MALVGKENTAKTGLTCDLALKHTDKRIVVLDCDNSAQNTVDYLVSSGVKNTENIQVIPLMMRWMGHVERGQHHELGCSRGGVEWFTAQIGEDAEDIGAVIMDGGSTFLKWCGSL